MKSRLIILAAVTAFLFSCASTHPGEQGKSIAGKKLPLAISAENIDNPNGEAFQLIEVTVENTSDDWLRISDAKAVISNPAESKLSVVMGKDLQSWAEAMEVRLKKDEYNRKLLQVGLMGAGAIASGGKNDTVSAIGAVTLIGTAAWAVSDVIKHSYNLATQSEKAPENHLYRPFSVPGKMFQRRWILFNKPSKTVIKNLVLEFETAEGEKGTYEINI